MVISKTVSSIKNQMENGSRAALNANSNITGASLTQVHSFYIIKGKYLLGGLNTPMCASMRIRK